MPGLRRAPVLSLLALLGGLAVAGPGVPAGSAAQAAARGPVITQPCGGSSWFAGTTNVCDGAVVHRDYVYDDAGADTGGIGYGSNTQNAYGTLAPPAGDQRYPADDTTSADLVSLRLSRRGSVVDVVAELNALRTARSTVLALAVDADGNGATGGGVWTGLGVRSAGWDKVYRFDVGDPGTNTIRGSFPLPAVAAFRVQAVTAQADGTVMNIAFRGVDEHAAYKLDGRVPSAYPYTGQGAWFEDDQAAALATGDISRFGYVVQRDDLRPGVNRLSTVGAGLHERVYTSRYTLGEGLSYAGIKGRGTGGGVPAFAQVFNLLGKYQPYGVYVPHHAGPYGLQMEWHGSNQGIVAQVNQPGMQQQFGEDLNRLLVVPEARGPNGYGSDISERDLLDVMADVQSVYPVDRDRVFSSGYSQGGYITYRMAMLFPDLFAGYTSWVGFTGDDTNGTPAAGSPGVTAGAVGNMIDYVGNLRHVPGSLIFAAQDELVQVPSSSAMEQALAKTDDAYTWFMHNPADHFTFAVLDDWRKEAALSKDQRLVRDPARVTFRTDPALDSPTYGIRHDRAYWLSGVRSRTGGPATVDVHAQGCGRRLPLTQDGLAGAGPAPVPWVSRAAVAVGSRATTARARVAATLTGVSALTLDVRRTCLTGRVEYRIVSDGPALLSLSDGRRVSLRSGVNQGIVAPPRGR